jgi:aconitase A
VNSFGARDTLAVGQNSYEIYRLDAVPGSEKLPYSLKVLAENLLRQNNVPAQREPHLRPRRQDAADRQNPHMRDHDLIRYQHLRLQRRTTN